MAQAPRRTGRPVEYYHPGEMVIVAQLPAGQDAATGVHADVQRVLAEQLPAGTLHAQQRRSEPIIFTAPNRDQRLAFFFYTLADARYEAVKHAVSGVHDAFPRLNPLRDGGVHPVGAMPHWHFAALGGYIGGSPGTVPRPV